MQAGPDKQEPLAAAGEEIEALVALVKLDYEHTLGFIDGVVRVSTSIRTIATAGWLALIAAAVQTGHGWLAVLASVGVGVLGLQDAYHGWLYAEARKRAVELERLLEGYYKYLQRTTQAGAAADLLKRLHNHRFGQRSRVPSLSRRGVVDPRDAALLDWRGRSKLRLERGIGAAENLVTVVVSARPKFFYRYLYLPLVLAGIAIALLLPGGSDSDDAQAAGEWVPVPIMGIHLGGGANFAADADLRGQL